VTAAPEPADTLLLAYKRASGPCLTVSWRGR